MKDYVYRGVNAFERVLHNIDLLTAAGILVNIRLNIDMYNIGEMADLVELLHQRFGTNEHLSVHCIQLYGEHSPEDNAELFARRMQLEQQLMQYGFRGQWGVRRDIKVNCCSADIEACATCFYYPQCILLTMCEIDVGCTPEYQQEHLHDIKESMKYEYERYLSNDR